ncbi:PAS domain S-box/diguanylate cyclase (GGDEF) domain-containing protein [Synechococcus sp. PCC 7502]|uniref:EAL domain-containing protein n=1 Tax=Synechococcus sp. PCC 7502 TaxID=1173263 RepID=UPI00029FE355|nr:EAL domain-containing protein [Synechococcus sp. PCC 7502]AFY74558.1 PAS domain S-box/diguanylate cyclase (GGDEF) domain-containing protein [Synechococcus sp. PCC 7502]
MKLKAANKLLSEPEIENLGELKPFYFELLKQQKLRSKLEKFRKSEDNGIGVFILSKEGYFIDASYGFSELLGYSTEELRNIQIESLILPEERPKLQTTIFKLVSGQSHQEDSRHCCITKDGQLVSLALNLFLLDQRLSPGTEIHLIVKFEDHTIGDRLEKSLQASVQTCQYLFDGSTVPQIIYNLQTLAVIAVNDAAIYHYGYDRSEFLTQDMSVLAPLGHSFDQFCEQHLKKSGQLIDVEVKSLELIYNDLPAQILSIRDITEQRRTKQALDALRQAEEDYRGIFENAVEGIFQTSESGKYLKVNPMLASIYGYDSPEDLMNGITDIANQLYVNPQRRLEFVELLKQQDAVLGFDSEVYRKDGSKVWISENVRSIRDTSGKLLRYEGTVVDITEVKLSEEALRLSEERFRLTFNYAPIGMMIKALNGQSVQVNQAIAQILGYTPSELLELTCVDITHPEDLPTSLEMRQRLLAGEFPSYQIPKRYIRKDGTFVDTLLHVSLTRDGNGEPIHFIDQIEDVSDRKRAEEKISYLAFHDPLTGLPNRALFNDRLNQALALASRLHQEQSNFKTLLAVMFIDLDRFKVVNDSLGHAMGDRLLQLVAERFTRNMRKSDTIARMGGDEFMLLLPEVKQVEDVVKVAEKILKSLSQPFHLDHHEMYITASIGICLYPHDGDDGDTLLKNADVAMYRAKEQGRNHYQIFTQSMHERAFEWMFMESSIRRAIAQDEFLVYYQPQLDLQTGKVISMEALIRWQTESGFIPPNQFIPIAEEYGLIIPIGEWVLRTACTQNKLWQNMGLPPIQIAVNFSAKQFQDPQLLQKVSRIIAETRLAPRYLEIEITESAVMKDEYAAAETLQSLKNMGVRISIDDFGKGYSSLSHLKKFPVQKLKIDAAFIREIPRNKDDAAITTAIIAIAHTLNLKAIAEGVETPEQLEFLRALGCDGIQGYIFSPAVTTEVATKILHDQRHFLASDLIKGKI